MVQAFTEKVMIDSFFKDVAVGKHTCMPTTEGTLFFLKKTKTILWTHDVQAASVKRQMAALTNTLDPCVEQKIIYVYYGCKEYGTHQCHRIFPP